jgi:hypothetical protein
LRTEVGRPPRVSRHWNSQGVVVSKALLFRDASPEGVMVADC